MNKFTLGAFAFSLILFVFMNPDPGVAQQKAVADTNLQQVENYREQIRRLMGFLEFSLNTLGSSETSTREKEVIINESYQKAFLNEKVQIEDDLDENREILTYKDVQAYLKDVDFFFKEAEFEIEVQDIQSLKNDQGMIYFKVTANRNLKAITVDDSVITNNKTRYVEINLDDEEQVLKIASIYTTRLNVAQEMMDWWNGMPLAWKQVLGSDYRVTDDYRLSQVDFLNDTTLLLIHEVPEIKEVETYIEIGDDSLLVMEYDTVLTEVFDTLIVGPNNGLSMLKEISKLESLIVEGNQELNNLYPVDQMTDLRLLNISNTPIDDLFPARNLNKMVSLNISGTNITDLSPIRYNTRVRELYLDQTAISSLAPIQDFTDLEILHFNQTAVDSLRSIRRLGNVRDLRFDNTSISDIQPLGDLVNLENLSMASTQVADLAGLEYLVTLKRINIENTKITGFNAFSRLENLQMIDADETGVSDLSPLANLPSLEKVYCDHTGITGNLANAFMAKHPNVLVIYESQALTAWWAGLNFDWQSIFRKYVSLDPKPGTEQLHQLTLLSKIDIEGNQNITSLEPLSKLTNLKEIKAGGTSISDIGPLSELIDLKTLYCANTQISSLLPLQSLGKLDSLDFSQTQIESLEGLENLDHLLVLVIDNTGVEDLSPLKGCMDLKIIYCDNTKIGQIDIDPFLDSHPACLVIYQSNFLTSWWKNLSPVWKSTFRAQTQLDEPPTREQLHTLAAVSVLDLNGSRDIKSLEPLTVLHRIEDLNLANGTLQDISPIGKLVRLIKLNLSGNPVEDITPISFLPSLLQLDISNTAITRLDAVKTIGSLEQLNCSGTQIKKLDPLSSLNNLKKLECFNTEVNNLKPLMGLVKLKNLVCYNTKLSEKKVESFKESMPGLEVVFY